MLLFCQPFITQHMSNLVWKRLAVDWATAGLGVAREGDSIACMARPSNLSGLLYLFPRPAQATIATCFYSPPYFLVLLFLLTSLPAVPIRRNLIGNQSFWGKNGAWLSITVPWVLPAERGVQKRLCAGTVVGKVNAADTLSSALFQTKKGQSVFWFFSTDKVFSMQF